MVHPWINDWQKGGKHQVEVAEFFSGRVYAATLTTKGNYGAMVESGDKRIELNCASKRSLGGLGKEYPVDRDGSYIERVGVDESGKYGIDRVTDKCEVGAVCDIGVDGLVRSDASGNASSRR